MTGRDESQIRRWMRPATKTVNERSVERVGLEAVQDPRLVDDLYPDIAFVGVDQ